MSKLLDDVRSLMRMMRYSYEAEKRSVYRIRQFIFVNNARRPIGIAQ